MVGGKKNSRWGYMHGTKQHNFYFVKPIPNIDTNTLSEELKGVEGIKDVYVTENDHGFIVAAKSDIRSDLGSYIAKIMNDKYDFTLRYYSYRKR